MTEDDRILLARLSERIGVAIATGEKAHSRIDEFSREFKNDLKDMAKDLRELLDNSLTEKGEKKGSKKTWALIGTLLVSLGGALGYIAELVFHK